MPSWWAVTVSGCLATVRNKGFQRLPSRHMLSANCISAYTREQLKSVISTYVRLAYRSKSARPPSRGGEYLKIIHGIPDLGHLLVRDRRTGDTPVERSV